MEAVFRLRFLGTVQIERNGKPVRGFRSRKALAILGYLAVQNQPVPREQLADLFWEDKPEAIGRANLSWTLNKLASLLPGCLQTDHHTVQFQRTDSYWLDMDRFETLEAREDAASLAAAVELARGEFMSGLDLDGCAEFGIWLVGERERWRQRVVQALDKLISHHTRRGEYPQSLRFAQHLLTLEPWLEETHCQVMRLLARDGQRSAALAQYETCRRILAQELGVKPSAETTALYERIRAASSARRRNLPDQPTPFVGREKELAEVIGLLDDPDCRLLTILGPGGIGKTRLAIEAAAARQGAFLEGVYFVPLAGTGSVEFLAPAVAGALQLSLFGLQDPMIQLLDYVRDKEMLLVLDSMEHLLEGTKFLAEILQTAPDVKLLVTSRECLNLRWERCFQVEGLACPADETAADGRWREYGAAQLFLQVAQQRLEQFSLSACSPSAIIRICRLVEGMPLGIELAAAWVRTRTCGEIAQEIERDLGFLATPLRDVPDRHRSMQAAFEHSWRLLTRPEQEVFAKLSVFCRGFSAEAADDVAGASQVILESLVNKSLVRFMPWGRYEMHELLRQFAAEKLAATPAAQGAAHDWHCTHYAAFLQDQQADLAGAGAARALAAIRVEVENVRAAWQWAVAQGRLAELERSSSGLSYYYLFVGPFQEGEALLGLAVERVRALAQHKSGRGAEIVLSKLLVERARLLNARGMYDEVIAAAQEAIGLAQAGQSVELEAAGHLVWGQALRVKGNHAAALGRLEQALALSQLAQLKELEADGLNDLGLVHVRLCEYDKGRARLEQALCIYDEIGDLRGKGKALNHLGIACFQQGDYASAIAYHKQALHIADEMSDLPGKGKALGNLGNAYKQQGDLAGALVYYEQALRVLSEIGDRLNEGAALLCLGNISELEGDYAQAQAYFRQRLQIATEIGNRQGEGIGLASLGIVSERQGDLAGAIVYYEQALRVLSEIGDRHNEGGTLLCLGEAYERQGDYAQAQACYWQGLRIATEIGDRPDEGLALLGLGNISERQGDYAQAQIDYEKSLGVFRSVGVRHDESLALACLCLLSYHLGEDETACEYGQQALRIAQEIGSRNYQGYALTRLGHALAGLERWAEATETYRQAVALRRELGQPHLTMEPLAGLARIAALQGDLAQAQACTEEILSHLKAGSLYGADEPFRVYLTCYRVLRAAGDARAQAILETAHRLLQERAARISDEKLRHSFLENVAAHREIVQEVGVLA